MQRRLQKLYDIQIPYKGFLRCIAVLFCGVCSQLLLTSRLNDYVVLGLVIIALIYPAKLICNDSIVIDPISLRERGERAYVLQRLMVTGLMLIATLCAIVGYAYIVTGLHINVEPNNNQDYLSELTATIAPWRYIVLACISAPILEELLFRQALLHRFVTGTKFRKNVLVNRYVNSIPLKHIGFWITLMAQGFLFATMHIAGDLTDSTSWTTVPIYIIIGTGAGLTYALTGSSKYNVLFHATYNLIATSVMYL